MTYGEIKARFLGLINNNLLRADTALQDTFLQLALARIQRELRIPAMERGVIATIDTYSDGIVIPSDLLELKQIVNSDGKPLSRVSLTTALQQELCSGVPEVFARQGGRFRLGPYPISGDTVRMDYYAEMTALTEAADTNTLSEIAPDLIIYCTLAYAGDNYKDERAPTWASRYESIRDGLHDQANRDELSGNAVVDNPGLQSECW